MNDSSSNSGSKASLPSLIGRAIRTFIGLRLLASSNRRAAWAFWIAPWLKPPAPKTTDETSGGAGQ